MTSQKPEVLQKIFGEVMLRDILEERDPEGLELFYAPDSETPYTGWALRELAIKLDRDWVLVDGVG